MYFLRMKAVVTPAKRMLVVIAFMSSPIGAQDPNADAAAAHPEIRGVVSEWGTSMPVVDAEVSVSLLSDHVPRLVSALDLQAAVATTKTDAGGRFALSLPKLGEYRIEAKKEGFKARGPAGTPSLSSMTVVLDRASPFGEVRLTLARSGEITGHVVDWEDGTAVPDLPLVAWSVAYRAGHRVLYPGATATTDADGKFLFQELSPAAYVLEVRPRMVQGHQRIIRQFSEVDLDAVDRDFEPSYWPGGSDRESATPLSIGSGDSADLGTLQLRKTFLYRARVSLQEGSCTPSDIAVFYDFSGRRHSEIGEAPCVKGDFLIRGFPSGEHHLEVWTKAPSRTERKRGLVAFLVIDRNVSVTIPLTRGLDISGKVTAAKGATLPDLSGVQITLRPTAAIAFSDDAEPSVPDNTGAFRLVGVAAVPHQVSISGLTTRYYVKEVRYNGTPLSDRVLRLDNHAVPGSLEVVVDDKPAVLTGVVTDRDRVVNGPYVVLVNRDAADIRSSALFRTGDNKGEFRFAGLAPGKYRILAVPATDRAKLDEPNVLERLATKATSCTLGAGAWQRLSLELMEP